jgi:hypothetical protein
MSDRDKQIWNEAVKATLKEVKKYDGLIPDDSERLYLCKSVYERVSYRSDAPNPFREAGYFLVPTKVSTRAI